MMIVGNGFTAGAAFGGFIAAWLIPRFGWRSVFYFGAAAPLVIAAIMIFALPESLQFLVLHRKRLEQAARWLKRIDPTASSDASQYFVEETKRKGVPWVHLFLRRPRRGNHLAVDHQFHESAEPLFPGELAANGGQPGRIWDRDLRAGGNDGATGRNDRRVHSGFVRATLGLRSGADHVLRGRLHQHRADRTAGHIAGDVISGGVSGRIGVVGGQTAVNALSATYYPTDLRATGIGAGLGIGRIGAIIGPVVGGVLMSQHLPTQKLFLVAAVPALISAIVMLAMHWVLKAQTKSAPKAAVPAPIT